MPRVTRLAGAVLATLAGWAQAQATDSMAQRVEIVGTTPVGGAGIERDRVPGNVQTASGGELERSQASDLGSFLARRLGSVHVNEIQNNPFQPDVNYRGFTASPVLGTAQGLSVYLDGVRVNQPFGDVVSWDLIPRSAIASMTLMPGSNPIFGLNTLGGALALETKDGQRHAGSEVQAIAGQFGRRALEFEHGGSAATGWHWLVTGNRFHERGWRDASPSDVGQLFAKVGRRVAGSDLWASVALADNRLSGNALQEVRLLERLPPGSIYTKTDTTNNRGVALALGGTQPLDAAWSLSGVAYVRRLHSHTISGDVNEATLDQPVYQPDAGEQAALAAAGYSGFPTSGESAANAAFPKWRCIASVLLQAEPARLCNGQINRTRTAQTHEGLSAQLNWRAAPPGWENLLVVGAAYDGSRVDFSQSSEIGYLNPDRSVTGLDVFADGAGGGSLDGLPYDTRVDLASRTRTWSAFATDTLSLGRTTHLTLAARYNRTSVTTRDRIVTDGGAGSLDGDHRFSRLNPAIGLTFAALDGVGAYAGLNEGSRAPSAVELGCADPANPCKLPNAFAGDPPLRQVVARTHELGLRGTGGGTTRWSIGLFRTDNTDDILFVADNAAGFGYFKNFGKTRRQGLEASLSTRVGGATLGANYTWLDATVRSPEVVNGNGNSSNDAAMAGTPGVDGTIAIEPGQRIPGQPRQILKLFAELPLSTDFGLAADLAAVGSSPSRGNENGAHRSDGVYYLGPGGTGGYALLNLTGEYKPSTALKFFVQVNNVFDRRYATAAQLGPTAFDDNGRYVARPLPANADGAYPLRHSTFVAPGAPRTAWFGFRAVLGD